MAICSQTYLGCELFYDYGPFDGQEVLHTETVSGQDYLTALILAGTEADFRITVDVLSKPGLSDYQTINWSASVSPSCTWLRLRGKYWNTAGQTTSLSSIDLSSITPDQPADEFFVTASGINPPPVGGFKADGLYTTVLTINYTAIHIPTGTPCTGTVSFLIGIKVIHGKRYMIQTPLLTFTSTNGRLVGTPQNVAPIQAPVFTGVSPEPPLGTVAVIYQFNSGLDWGFDLPLNFVSDPAAIDSGTFFPVIPVQYYVLSLSTPNASYYSEFPDVTWNSDFEVPWTGLDATYNPDAGTRVPRPLPIILGHPNHIVSPVPTSNVHLSRASSPPATVGIYGTGSTGFILTQTDMWLISQVLSGGTNYDYWLYLVDYPARVATPLGSAPSAPECSVSMIVGGSSVDPGAIPFNFAGGATSVSVNYNFDFTGIVTSFDTTPTITLVSTPPVSSTGFGATANPLVYHGTFTLLLSNVPGGGVPGSYFIPFGDLVWTAAGTTGSCDASLVANAVVSAPPTPTPTPTTPPTPTPTPTTPPTPTPTPTTPPTPTPTPTTPPTPTPTPTPTTPPTPTPTPTTPPTPTPTPTTPPPAPPGFINYTGTPVDKSGGALYRVPFKLSASPVEIRIQADQRSGLLSGEFQVGLQIQPGPMARSQVGGVVDLIRLYATGDGNVQFFSQLPQEQFQNQVTLELNPVNWDVLSGHPYDLTFQLIIKNISFSPFLVDLVILDSTPGLVTAFSNNLFTMVSGAQETVLVAVKVISTDSGRKFLSIGNNPGINPVNVIPAAAVVNLDPLAVSPALYKISDLPDPSDYYCTIGSAAPSQTFTTGTTGISSPESWGVSDIEFLSKHGLRFSLGGVLSSDTNVIGPAEQKDVMFFVEQNLDTGEKSYASKIVTIHIT